MSETCRGSDKVRVAWVDAARVIAMFAVMQSHAYIVKDALHSQQHLGAGAVGLFFLLAGYFAHFKGWAGYCRRIVALVCFYVFYALYALFVAKHGAIFDWRVIFAQLLHPSGSPLWFIQYLLLATIALPVLDKMNGWVSAIVAVILQVWGCCDICTRDYTHVCMS
ncbi:MAG: acyltransferase family protein, partial [Akkermansia sp.]|nr:acyltransferase family protein [Akkermansia sp.]